MFLQKRVQKDAMSLALYMNEHNFYYNYNI